VAPRFVNPKQDAAAGQAVCHSRAAKCQLEYYSTINMHCVCNILFAENKLSSCSMNYDSHDMTCMHAVISIFLGRR
jgi:hypothetical protein